MGKAMLKICKTLFTKLNDAGIKYCHWKSNEHLEAGLAGETITNLSSTIEESADMAMQISASTDQQTEAMSQLVKAVQSIKEASSQASVSFTKAGL